MVVWHISFLPSLAYLMIKKQALTRWECGMDMNGFGSSPSLYLYEEKILVY
jgi:hypothetical protein